MATTRQRRAGNHSVAQNIPQDERIYTEEDYAAKTPGNLPDEWEAEQPAYAPTWSDETDLPDEAFQPDEEEYDAQASWSESPAEDYAGYLPNEEYTPLFDTEEDFSEDFDPLDDDLLTEEEQAELKRSHWQLISGLADFAGVIMGTAAILLLVMLLVSLLNWLINDMNQSFILLQKNL